MCKLVIRNGFVVVDTSVMSDNRLDKNQTDGRTHESCGAITSHCSDSKKKKGGE